MREDDDAFTVRSAAFTDEMREQMVPLGTPDFNTLNSKLVCSQRLFLNLNVNSPEALSLNPKP
jgi:hypothetical protein